MLRKPPSYNSKNVLRRTFSPHGHFCLLRLFPYRSLRASRNFHFFITKPYSSNDKTLNQLDTRFSLACDATLDTGDVKLSSTSLFFPLTNFIVASFLQCLNSFISFVSGNYFPCNSISDTKGSVIFLDSLKCSTAVSEIIGIPKHQ